MFLQSLYSHLFLYHALYIVGFKHWLVIDRAGLYGLGLGAFLLYLLLGAFFLFHLLLFPFHKALEHLPHHFFRACKVVYFHLQCINPRISFRKVMGVFEIPRLLGQSYILCCKRWEKKYTINMFLSDLLIFLFTMREIMSI